MDPPVSFLTITCAEFQMTRQAFKLMLLGPFVVRSTPRNV
jgi:hypothetical protein